MVLAGTREKLDRTLAVAGGDVKDHDSILGVETCI